MNDKDLIRCSWVGTDPIYLDYHDNEWGRPVHDDRQLFEAVILDGFQAGLSWLTILKKRAHFRMAFDHFDAKKMVDYDAHKIAELLANPGIVRNKLKVNAAVTNAKAFLEVQQEFGAFDKYIWQFTGYQTILNNIESIHDYPSTTLESDAMSKDMKKRGFKFCGSTICYAFMQAVGMVNDHHVDCFCR